MDPTYMKILVISFIFLGESLSIYAEMVAARTYIALSTPFFQAFWKMFLIAIAAGGLLIAGYMLGLEVFKNIWIVSVTSITSILITEPTLAYIFFKQAPTLGAAIGLTLGAVGFAATIFIK
jgi:hypothetical protein